MPIGGASAVEGLRSTGLPRLVFVTSELTLVQALKKKNDLYRRDI